MIHFFKRHWQYLKEGSITVGIASVVLLVAGTNAVLLTHRFKDTIRLQTADAEVVLNVTLAKTPHEHAVGLMGVKSLPEGQGMLFVFRRPQQPAFWMKNMKIPLDMVFIGTDLRIASIAEKVPPCSVQGPCPSTTSPAPVSYVLEVPSGYTKKKNIRVGDRLIF